MQFKCCGITNFKDWRFGRSEQESIVMSYPSSCCDHAKLKKTGLTCGESQVWLESCLEMESLQIMTIGYTALLISILQFLFMVMTHNY